MTQECSDTEAPGYVLVVDDDPDARQVLAQALEDEGYRTETARNGREAMNRVRRGRPPCVMLLDLMMPIMDGWEVVLAMRGNGALSRIPIVVTSAFADRAPANVDHVLCKPLNLDSLLIVVGEFCRPASLRSGEAPTERRQFDGPG